MDGQQIESSALHPAGQKAAPGFFGGLFDLSFTEFVTTRVLRTLYLLSMLGIGFSALITMFSGFTKGVLGGMVTMILTPILAIISLIVVRIYFEIILVIFRISETLIEINAKTR